MQRGVDAIRRGAGHEADEGLGGHSVQQLVISSRGKAQRAEGKKRTKTKRNTTPKQGLTTVSGTAFLFLFVRPLSLCPLTSAFCQYYTLRVGVGLVPTLRYLRYRQVFFPIRKRLLTFRAKIFIFGMAV